MIYKDIDLHETFKKTALKEQTNVVRETPC